MKTNDTPLSMEDKSIFSILNALGTAKEPRKVSNLFCAAEN